MATRDWSDWWGTKGIDLSRWLPTASGIRPPETEATGEGIVQCRTCCAWFFAGYQQWMYGERPACPDCGGREVRYKKHVIANHRHEVLITKPFFTLIFRRGRGRYLWPHPDEHGCVGMTRARFGALVDHANRMRGRYAEVAT